MTPMFHIFNRLAFKWLALAGFLWLAGAGMAAADPAGDYSVAGANPNGSTYEGSVKVRPDGDSYAVTWRIGGQTFTGVGLDDGQTFAVAYSVSSLR